MKRRSSSIFLLLPVNLILLFFVSCGPALLPPALPAVQTTATACSPQNWPCPSDSLTLTAAMEPLWVVTLTDIMLTNTTLTALMESTLSAIPTNTPPPWAAITPAAGDLGWGSVYGTIIDALTNLPLEGVTVTCQHSSYTSQYLCNGVTITNQDGAYAFTDIFFHDTDRITLLVEAPGYTPLRFEQASFTQPEFHNDWGLFPTAEGTSTPTATPFLIMCTPPACSDGVLVCGAPNGCPAGCGAICLPNTPTP